MSSELPDGHQVVGLYRLDRGLRAREAVDALRAALAGAEVGEPDDTGAFDVELTAPSREEALHTVWNAIASSGADDHVSFLEHADIPEHWKRRPDVTAG